MKCPRCQGFMVKDQIYDPEGPFLRIDVWRCINCGETLDPAVLRIRKDHTKKESKIQKVMAA